MPDTPFSHLSAPKNITETWFTHAYTNALASIECIYSGLTAFLYVYKLSKNKKQYAVHGLFI